MTSRLRASVLSSIALPALLLACGSAVESGPPSFGAPPPGASNSNQDVDSSQDSASPNGSNTSNTTTDPNDTEQSSPSDLQTPEDQGDGDAEQSAPWQPPPLDPSTPVGINGQLRVEGQNLVNQSGQPIQLEGISSMWLNWEERFSQDKQGLQWLRDNWNITLYRVAVGVEPDNAYLAQPERMMELTRKAVQNAIDLGLYVLIDWHAHEAHESPEAAEAFFRQVAAEFGEFPHVLYETFNEPLGDHDWSNTIKPFHERMIPVIRAEDPDSVIILGNRQWDQRPDEAAADPVNADNVMYTVHFYACDHQGGIRENAQRAYDAGLALFVTEWGATPADGGDANPIVCADAAQEWFDWMDARNIGSAAWKFDTCDHSSCFFNRSDVPTNGGWTDEWLTDHARFIRDRLLE